MKAIGGYLPWEFAEQRDSVSRFNAYPVNLGRFGLELVLRRRNYRRAFVPRYICPVVFETLRKVGVEYAYYSLDASLAPVLDAPLAADEALLYVDYFGVKDATTRALASETGNFIADLTQAFYFEPPKGCDAFNSVRKFVGAPDGGYVFGDFVSELDLPRQEVFSNCAHLLMRAEDKTEEGYRYFRANSDAMGVWEPERMSLLSEKILKSVSLEEIATKRRKNFLFLHERLESRNELKIDVDKETFVPLCYPLLVENGKEIKKKLIENKVFVPTYWPGLDEVTLPDSFERRLIDDLVCLPIDQNLNSSDLMFELNEVFTVGV